MGNSQQSRCGICGEPLEINKNGKLYCPNVDADNKIHFLQEQVK